MMHGYELYAEEQREDFETDKVREEIEVSLTDKQYSNLKLKAYKAGFESVGELIQSFVSDLTGWQSNGSDERDKASDWYERAHGDWNCQYYFQYFLYNFDFNYGELQGMLADRDYLDEIYEEYRDNAYGVDIQSKEECVKVLEKVVEDEIQL